MLVSVQHSAENELDTLLLQDFKGQNQKILRSPRPHPPLQTPLLSALLVLPFQVYAYE